MKVIELINKIANGEEVPNKIKYCDEMFMFTGYDSASKNYNNELEDLFEVLNGSMLNDEVEIIDDEEWKTIKEHKIPEKLDYKYENIYHNISKCKHSEIRIIDKINEILDYLEEI